MSEPKETSVITGVFADPPKGPTPEWGIHPPEAQAVDRTVGLVRHALTVSEGFEVWDLKPDPAGGWVRWEDAQAELVVLRAENTTLRSMLPKLGAPCAYCGLTEIAKCAHGFPGCPQADDLMAGEEEGWQETVKRMRAAEAAAQRRLELLAQVMFYIPDAPRNALTERAHALNDAIQAEMAKGKGS